MSAHNRTNSVIEYYPLFSLNPSDPSNALAKVHELEANNLRANFAQQFFRMQNPKVHEYGNNLRYPTRNYYEHFLKPEPMDVNPSSSQIKRMYGQKTNFNPNYRQSFNNFRRNDVNNNFERAQVNKNANYFNKPQDTRQLPEKRHYESSRQNSGQIVQKAQRVNRIKEEAFLA